MTLTQLMKTSFKWSWQLLIILHPLKRNALRVHRKIGLMLKCIRFCLKLQSKEHISNEHFLKLNWLTINQSFQQCVTSTVFKFVQNKCPAYMNEVFRSAENMTINTRNSFLKLNHPFRKTSTR